MLYDNSVFEVLNQPAQFMSEQESPSKEEQIEPHQVASDEVEQEIEQTVETLSSLRASLKKSRWNVFMFLGLAVLMFGFALFPLSLDVEFDPFTGTAEEDLGLVWGPSANGKDFMDVPFEVSVKVNQLPPVTDNITLQVFALQMDDCTNPEESSDATGLALAGESHKYQYDFVNSPVEGETYIFDFDLDYGQYCFYVKVAGQGGTVVDTSSTNIDVTGKLWPNQVITGLPGIIFLGLSIAAFVGAQKVGNKVKAMLENDKITEEQIVLEEARRKRIVAGPGAPPGSVAGPDGSPSEVTGPTTKSPSNTTGPTNVAAASTDSVKSGPPPAESTTAVESVVIETAPVQEDGSIFEDAGNGYFYRKMANGGYEQQIYIKDAQGQYVPYQAQ